MRFKLTRKQKVLSATVIAVGLLAAGGAAYAAIAPSPVDSAGIIHGCYTDLGLRGSHALVLQDTASSCPRGTTAITWNQQGPAGATGPAGAAGPAGPSTAGPTGLDLQLETAQGVGAEDVACPTSHPYAISGSGTDVDGGALSSDGNDFILTPGQPRPSLPNGWVANAVNLNDTIFVSVLCAK